MIQLKNVSKSYVSSSSRVNVLRDASISVGIGQFIGIVGPSGSGKTTILQLMGLLESPTDGEIWIDSTETNSLTKTERARIRNQKISYVFQQYQLLPALTAIENVMMPVLQYKQNKEIIDRAEYLLEQVGLADRHNHTPAKLSGGEQQRIAIARSLMSDPDIILADEMTGNLDEDTSESIMQLFKSIHEKEKKTIVMVTHNMELINYMEGAYQLRNGQLTQLAD